MKVGIDLSSTNTGLVILSDDNKLIWHGNFKLWDNSSQKPNRVFVRELFDIINCKRLNKLEKITIGVELSDFGNWKYADRFNFIAGALYQEHYCQEWGMMGEFICFNSNEWQQHLGLKPSMERQFRKNTARQFVKNNCLEYQDIWTEDECDAYCIAYFLEQLRDRREMHQEVKAKRVRAKKSKLAEKNEQIRKLKKCAKLREIIAKYDKCIASGKKLTKSQINAQERAIKELKELKNE